MDYINFYKSYCKKIDSFTLGTVVETVVEFIVEDNKCSAENKMLFSDWIATKIHNYYKIPAESIKNIENTLKSNIYLIKSAPVLALYLYFINHDLSINLCNHVYSERLDDKFFINQMMNDSTLLKHYRYTLEGEEYLDHFINWIKKTDSETQKSNLLDVLLSDHNKDERVKKIHEEMQGGSSLYENKQNVHDDEISIPLKTACVELLKWSDENIILEPITVGGELIEVNRGEWIKKFLTNLKIDPILIGGILQRTMIDRNQYNLVDGKTASIFDVLYAVSNYISRAPKDLKKSLVKILEEEMNEAIELCASGYIERFVNVLQGFDDRFQIKLNFFPQLYAKVNDMILKQIKFEPANSNVILGTYDEKYRKSYFKFILKYIDLDLLYEQYGENDVKKEICNVLNKITSSELWKLENGKLCAGEN